MDKMEKGQGAVPPHFASPAKTDGEEFSTPPSRVSRKDRELFV